MEKMAVESGLIDEVSGSFGRSEYAAEEEKGDVSVRFRESALANADDEKRVEKGFGVV